MKKKTVSVEDAVGGDALVRVGVLRTAVCSRGCGLASMVGPEVHEHGAVGSQQSR